MSLNSSIINEESLNTLFADLPRRCLVLLEDIDTAGLAHTRDATTEDQEPTSPVASTMPGGPPAPPKPAKAAGRISLSALLNIIDGVAASEGRILIMTTNHLEKLDEALIRPGRIDMIVKFDLASTEMIATLFRNIFATIEGDLPKPKRKISISFQNVRWSIRKAEKARLAIKTAEEHAAIEEETQRLIEEERVAQLADEFAAIVPGMIFSPAELQGYLLRWKRRPDAAVAGAADWVSTTITDKKKLEREEREKEEKEKAERAKAEKEKLELAQAERQRSIGSGESASSKFQTSGRKPATRRSAP